VKTRRPLAVLTATAIAGLGLTALATPASADTTVTIGNTVNDPEINPDSATGTSVTIVIVDHDTVYRTNSSSLMDADGNPCDDPGTDCNVTGQNGSATFLIQSSALNASTTWTNNNNETVELFVTYSDGSAPAPAAAPAPAPATVDVTLDQITSEVLRTWASTATLGSWKQLPESNAITGVDENAGKTFLGAATTPDFPVDIAQRQVDNGWGAYETFNEEGQITSVFIPAGKWMNINGPTRLYAIWSD